MARKSPRSAKVRCWSCRKLCEDPDNRLGATVTVCPACRPQLNSIHPRLENTVLEIRNDPLLPYLYRAAKGFGFSPAELLADAIDEAVAARKRAFNKVMGVSPPSRWEAKEEKRGRKAAREEALDTYNEAPRGEKKLVAQRLVMYDVFPTEAAVKVAASEGRKGKKAPAR